MKLSTTRQAIHDALAWGYLQTGIVGIVEFLVYLTRVEKSLSHRDQNVDFLEAAYICAAVNSLRDHVGGWLKFAYGPDEEGLIQDSLASKLRFDLFPISTARRHVRYFNLATTSLEDFRLRLRRNRDLPIQVYSERLNVPQPNFYRDGWGDKKDLCLNRIRIWDREGVGQVSRMVKSLKGDSDDSPTEILRDLANDKSIGA
jgi:hypothetical protein